MAAGEFSLGAAASDDDLQRVITVIARDHPSDAQVAADLAGTLARSGTILSFSSDLTADVASTGGPSSITTLLCPLYLRAGGASVPKLGVPGRPAGGIDALAQLNGFRPTLSAGEAQNIVETKGHAHFLADATFAPLDARMFSFRAQMGAKAIPTLVCASILSKKLAVGVYHLGLDVRVAPHGNFGDSWTAARANARLFVKTAHLLGIRAVPVLTDGRFPFQPYIGRSESLCALSVAIRTQSQGSMAQHVSLCRAAALAALPEHARDKAASASSDRLNEILAGFLSDQGSSLDVFDTHIAKTTAAHLYEFKAEYSGFASFDLAAIRDRLVGFQQTAGSIDSLFPDPLGLILRCETGEWVSKGATVATMRADKRLYKEAMTTLLPYLARPSHIPQAPSYEVVL